MSFNVNLGSRFVLCALSVLALVVPRAEAVLYPGFTELEGVVNANVQGDPIGPNVGDSDSAGPTDYAVNVNDNSTAGDLSSDATVVATAHVDAAGDSGTATLAGTWIATNTSPSPGGTFGSFGITMTFFYSYYSDTPSTLTIDINTTLTGGGGPVVIPPDLTPMHINHALNVDYVEYTAIAVGGNTHVVIPLAAGGHSFELYHAPNSGLGPWPNVNTTFTDIMTFSIEVEPQPGDTDGDGDVDFDDFLAVNNFFGDAGPDSPGDADGDGDCDFDDFLAVSNFFGYPDGGGGEEMMTFVPEPASAGLLVGGLAALALRRGRR